jgi:hypothetical protein
MKNVSGTMRIIYRNDWDGGYPSSYGNLDICGLN